ncbi:pilus assembly protein TadC [Roseovarius sp. A46]|uniref:type II secretion system F family protein n=1 Tax=Roseovarius sp. A46 TaxID=2109331 RepID=UPI00101180C8|nr:type II secretion system F family protein [Roseovarius sp. A46]RXV60471.1 pilus assembly protein TadC [Roseovarius sp. A46]
MPLPPAIIPLLIDSLGPFGPVIALGGFGVLLMLVTLGFMLQQKPDPLDKLKQYQPGAQAAAGPRKDTLRAKRKNKKLDKYATFLEPQDSKQLSEMRLKLMQAGYRHRDAVRYFHAAQLGLALGFLALGILYFLLFKAGGETDIKTSIAYILGPGLVGYMMPKYWVTKRQQQRQEEIQDGFPDSLDMMLVCVEAGQSMDQAIIRVAKEIRSSYPALSEEYEIVALQMKAGRDKPSVLSEMGDRCGVQDISSFVTTLIQSQTFGTPVGDALRVYAGEMRDKRVMRAEEKANKLPTQMTLVTMTLTVPPLLIILVGPSMLDIMKLFTMGK